MQLQQVKHPALAGTLSRHSTNAAALPDLGGVRPGNGALYRKRVAIQAFETNKVCHLASLRVDTMTKEADRAPVPVYKYSSTRLS